MKQTAGLGRDTSGSSYLWLVVGGLVAYCIALTIFSGDIGFDGDDWWVLSWAYWHKFPGSVLGYAREFLRPMEGLYWISMFEVFGFDRMAYHFLSLLLGAGSCILMGVCLAKAFPKRRALVTLSAILAFFLPTVSSLTYLVFTDNSRLSLLLFWGSVLAFQFWAQRSQSWVGLIPGVLIYLLSFLTYEAPSFLIFVMPLLVWPVSKNGGNHVPRRFLVRIVTGAIAAFAAALSARFLLLDGGVVEHAGLIPPFELIWGYLALLPFYLAAPFTLLPRDPGVWAFALVVAVWTGLLLWFFRRDAEPPAQCEQRGSGIERFEASLPVIAGIGILLFGMLPYQLAGYGSAPPKLVCTLWAKLGFMSDHNPSWFNFNEASRIYSAASCGVAILLAALATAWKNARVRLVAGVVSCACIGIFAVFHAQLSTEWREASAIRNHLLRSLVSQVPAVKQGTNFVFFDLECYHKHAAVIRGWAGLRELIRMLYEDPTLGAWYVYPSADAWPNTCMQQAIVFPKGFVSRGMDLERPAPHESLLLFRRMGTSLVLTKKVEPDTPLTHTGICWRGGKALHSNPNRITRLSGTRATLDRLTANTWTHGLFTRLSELGAGSQLVKRRFFCLRNYVMHGRLLTKKIRAYPY